VAGNAKSRHNVGLESKWVAEAAGQQEAGREWCGSLIYKNYKNLVNT
jgi:hypothetical protein